MALPVEVYKDFELRVGKYIVRGERNGETVRISEKSEIGEKPLIELDPISAAELGIALRSVSACVRLA